jgi:hypothetical protein
MNDDQHLLVITNGEKERTLFSMHIWTWFRDRALLPYQNTIEQGAAPMICWGSGEAKGLRHVIEKAFLAASVAPGALYLNPSSNPEHVQKALNQTTKVLNSFIRTLIDSKTETDHRLCFGAYVWICAIERAIKTAQSIDWMRKSPVSLPSSTVKADIQKRIRSSCAGDLGEFIAYLVEFQQGVSIQSEHHLLARLVEFETFDKTDFSEPKPNAEVSRLVLPDLLETVGETFVELFTKVPNLCVHYHITDRLKITDIVQVPLFGVYWRESTNLWAMDILCLLTETELERI